MPSPLCGSPEGLRSIVKGFLTFSQLC
ncbi:hypothetical protein SPHINGO361_130182 [Sphingomonas sp. EC-HK361]|nr:hypothetical protein SPHINGO361_130182 [Sphingomonas sp. EC-HK361]